MLQTMDTGEKLVLLGGAARYEIADGRRSVSRPRAGHAPGSAGAGVRGALCTGESADGRSGTLLRVLQSSRCEHDCAYCPLRRSNDPQRAAFAPEELARAFLDMHDRGRVDGLLLSSAADGGPEQAMSRMLDTLRVLRDRFGYKGYVHLKVLPGASRAALEEAARLADRLSLNAEVPDGSHLRGLQTGKRWQEDIVDSLGYLHALDQAGAVRSGLSSQLLIGVAASGAVPASDRALSGGSRSLRRQFGLRRVHFGDFLPAAGTPLEGIAAPDPRRRARLYQLDWLSTQMGFDDVEIESAFDGAGNLPLALDPKVAVTLARPRERPLEINSASYEELLRVPGIGPVSALRILEYRALGALRDLADLRSLGVVAGRAAPFILLGGRRPPEAPASLRRLQRLLAATGPQPVQLRLWLDDAALSL